MFVSLLLLASSTPASGAGRTSIGSTLVQMSKTWRVDRSARPSCVFPRPIACDFFLQGKIHIVTGFLGLYAADFATRGYQTPAESRYWRFLVGRLPRGSRRTECRRFRVVGRREDSMDGPVWACLYRYRGHHIVVGQRLAYRGRLGIEGEVLWNGDFRSLGVAGD